MLASPPRAAPRAAPGFGPITAVPSLRAPVQRRPVRRGHPWRQIGVRPSQLRQGLVVRGEVGGQVLADLRVHVGRDGAGRCASRTAGGPGSGRPRKSQHLVVDLLGFGEEPLALHHVDALPVDVHGHRAQVAGVLAARPVGVVLVGEAVVVGVGGELLLLAVQPGRLQRQRRRRSPAPARSRGPPRARAASTPARPGRGPARSASRRAGRGRSGRPPAGGTCSTGSTRTSAPGRRTCWRSCPRCAAAGSGPCTSPCRAGTTCRSSARPCAARP